MSAQPKKAAGMKAKIAEMAAKRDADIALKRDTDIEINNGGDMPLERQRDVAVEPVKSSGPKPLPKVTLYAHPEVLKAIRLVAVGDGVQAQEILRRAVKEYLATRGHHFSDLTTGE